MTQWYEACKNDYCAAIRDNEDPDEVVCTATAAYARLCSECGVIIEWRSRTLCRKLYAVTSFVNKA